MPESSSSLDPEEMLAEARSWQQRTRFQWRHRGLAYVFWLWGLIWLVGYGGLFLWGVGSRAGWLWMGLWVVGLLGTGLIYTRYAWRVRPVHGEPTRAGFWIQAALFIALAFIVRPPVSPYQDGTRVVLYILWAYAVLGRITHRTFYTTWAIITALLITAGFVAFEERVFYLWMAVIGAGAWALGGIYQRRWEG